MSDKLADLAQRRESLILRSGGQRERLVESCEQLARSLRWARLARGIVQIITNPGALVGVTALLLGGARTEFRRTSSLLSFGWTVFHAIKSWRARRRA